MPLTRRRALLAGGAALGALTLPRPSFAAPAATPVSVAFGPMLPIYTLSAIAELKGFMAAEGLELKLVVGDAGSHGRQMLAAGQSLFAHGDAAHALQLTNRGKPCKILMATQMVASYANIVVRADLYEQGIKSVADFANYKRPNGAKPVIAATAIGAGTWLYGTYIFEARKFGNRVNWVAGGGSKTLLAGLQSKQFDAIMATPSWLIEIERAGFGKPIYDVREKAAWEADFGGTVPISSFYTLAETAEAHPGQVQALVNAVYRAMLWVRTAPIAEIYGVVAPKYFAGADPEAVTAELGFDRGTWGYDGRITPADFERGAKVWYRDGTDIPPTPYAQIVDMRYLDTAQAKFK